MKCLFCCSEAYPLAKTGGLGDVAGALPRALIKSGVQIKVLLPAYPAALAQARQVGLRKTAELSVDDTQVTLWTTRLPGSRVPVWLVDAEVFSGREGGLYGDAAGVDWPDNAWRFYLFSRLAELIATDALGLDWRPDIVHCHDWQTALVPALLSQHDTRPRTIFTVHNLAYRGIFDWVTFAALRLPEHWWHYEKLEFWGSFSYLKAGLVYADKITTVSPSYAREIQTEAFGCGLEGVLSQRREDLLGIINGIDTDVWNPGADQYLVATYNRRNLAKKALNKASLQNKAALVESPEIPLLGFIGRLVEQKGLALVLPALRALLARGRCQLVALGSGQPEFERALLALEEEFPQAVSVTIGYDEALSHQIEAGADIFLMPSLFEPCGLNQMYSQRYGTIPVCHYVGGLRDTVINLSESQCEGFIAGRLRTEDIDETGFLFCEPSVNAFSEAVTRALKCYQHPPLWRQLQKNGMNRDFSWAASAKNYVALYESMT